MQILSSQQFLSAFPNQLALPFSQLLIFFIHLCCDVTVQSSKIINSNNSCLDNSWLTLMPAVIWMMTRYIIFKGQTCLAVVAVINKPQFTPPFCLLPFGFDYLLSYGFHNITDLKRPKRPQRLLQRSF